MRGVVFSACLREALTAILDQWHWWYWSSLEDAIHRSMWAVSRRAGVTVVPQGTGFQVVSRAI